MGAKFNLKSKKTWKNHIKILIQFLYNQLVLKCSGVNGFWGCD